MTPPRRGLTAIGRQVADALDDDHDVTVVTWNVHRALDERAVSSLADLAREEGVDLFALQEARPDLPLPEGYGGHHARSYRRGALGPAEGVATLSRCSELTVQRVRSPRRELLVLTPKAALVTRYGTRSGGSLTLVNVHGLNFDPTGRNLARQLDDLAHKLEPYEGPLVLAGDFNTWNEDRVGVVRALTDRLDVVEARPQHPGGRKGGLRVPGVERRVRLNPRLHLDRLFVRGLTPVRAAWLDHVEGSDHAPLLVRLAWERPSPRS